MIRWRYKPIYWVTGFKGMLALIPWTLPALDCKIFMKQGCSRGRGKGEDIRSWPNPCLCSYMREGMWILHYLPGEGGTSVTPILIFFPPNCHWTGVSTPGIWLEKRQPRSDLHVCVCTRCLLKNLTGVFRTRSFQTECATKQGLCAW